LAESKPTKSHLLRIEMVHKVYARALVDLALEQGSLDEVASEMAQLEQVINREPKIALLMSAPTLNNEQRQAILENIFKGRVNPIIYQFFVVLNRKGQLGRAPATILAFRDVYGQQYGVVEVDAYVANAIDQARKEAIEKMVGGILGRDVAVQVYVQPELIGGIRLRIGDQLIDATVISRLQRMKQQIIEAGREQVRSGLETIVE